MVWNCIKKNSVSTVSSGNNIGSDKPYWGQWSIQERRVKSHIVDSDQSRKEEWQAILWTVINPGKKSDKPYCGPWSILERRVTSHIMDSDQSRKEEWQVILWTVINPGKKSDKPYCGLWSTQLIWVSWSSFLCISSDLKQRSEYGISAKYTQKQCW